MWVAVVSLAILTRVSPKQPPDCMVSSTSRSPTVATLADCRSYYFAQSITLRIMLICLDEDSLTNEISSYKNIGLFQLSDITPQKVNGIQPCFTTSV